MAAARYEQSEDFFVKIFSDPDMIRQVMETVGTVVVWEVENCSVIAVFCRLLRKNVVR